VPHATPPLDPAVPGPQSRRPVMALLDLLGRRWALRVLWELREQPSPTFRDLQDRCGGISSSVLADRLRELTEGLIVCRDERGYALTATGASLLAHLLPLRDWAAGWVEQLGEVEAGSGRRDDS
jgi:DNA-binding HxlR family transcriptional regulator